MFCCFLNSFQCYVSSEVFHFIRILWFVGNNYLFTVSLRIKKKQNKSFCKMSGNVPFSTLDFSCLNLTSFSLVSLAKSLSVFWFLSSIHLIFTFCPSAWCAFGLLLFSLVSWVRGVGYRWEIFLCLTQALTFIALWTCSHCIPPVFACRVSSWSSQRCFRIQYPLWPIRYLGAPFNFHVSLRYIDVCSFYLFSF